MEYLSEGAHLEDEGKDGVKEKKKKKKKKDKKKKKKKEVTLLANGYCVGYLSDLFNDTASWTSQRTFFFSTEEPD